MLSPAFFRIGLALLALLGLASAIGWALSCSAYASHATVTNLNQRIKAWWVMVAVMFAALVYGPHATIVVFAFSSFMALREFISLTPTRRADHWPLCIAFMVVLPLQYVLLWVGWYGLFAIFVPVYGFALITGAAALSQDTEDFLSRSAGTLFAVLTCVYGISYAPALLLLDIPQFAHQDAQLLFFFILVVQADDVLQYVAGQLFGRTPLAPRLSPKKTWEGLIVGAMATLGVAWLVRSMTPFSGLATLLLAAIIICAGTCGGLILSAVKRSLRAKHWGSGIAGHGGYLDRLDSVAFSAPIFFHIVRWYWAG